MPALGRKFEPVTINKFKGLNTGFLGSTPEQYSQEPEELADITNFNVTTDGFLEKRNGASLVRTITTPYSPSQLRLLLLQRTRVGNLDNRLFLTNGLDVWRVSTAGGTGDRMTVAGGPMSGLMSMAEYGGSAPQQAYNCTGVRLDLNASNPTAAGGVVGFYGDSTTNYTSWIPNTPMGTQLVLFKNRGWVINSFGANYTTAYGTNKGDETKVWYSSPGGLADWGGAGVPNNFNLDYADGDICTSMIVFNDQLIVFKTRKTFVISADGQPSDWQQRLISDRIGCVGRGTTKLINGIIYFLSADGVMRTDGTTFQNISGPVKDFLWQFDEYVHPQTVVDLYASYWEHKYILWLPSQPVGYTTCTRALVYDVRTEIWTKWEFAGNVTPCGEATWDEHYPGTLFVGSWNSNRIYSFGGANWRDNATRYDCSFLTKKYDLGKGMRRKRNHFVGLSVVDNYIQRGTYQIDVTADDTTTTTHTEATTTSQTTMNIKAKGAGYGRYFQTRVTQNSSQYAAVYSLTLMNEERGFEQRSMPS